ncbi:MAG: DUF3783 domain-containing protein [Desulfobacteraceae bacterium]|nr:DUF3783 domain-containing protein [Desulfobacteraceae bacterium]
MNHSLKVVGESREKMYGPRSLLICGFSSDERKTILKIFKNKKFKNLPIVYITDEDRLERMKNMVIRDHESGLDSECGLERAIIMSGLTEKELHLTMSAYKKMKLPKPLWATLTPTSQNWTVEALISELNNERLHLEK